jgi:hypothetical protein
MGKSKEQRSLDKWTKQEWRTQSGKNSSDTGEVYLPKRRLKSLLKTLSGKKKLQAANRKKKESDKQFVSHGLHKGQNYT